MLGVSPSAPVLSTCLRHLSSFFWWFKTGLSNFRAAGSHIQHKPQTRGAACCMAGLSGLPSATQAAQYSPPPVEWAAQYPPAPSFSAPGSLSPLHLTCSMLRMPPTVLWAALVLPLLCEWSGCLPCHVWSFGTNVPQPHIQPRHCTCLPPRPCIAMPRRAGAEIEAAGGRREPGEPSLHSCSPQASCKPFGSHMWLMGCLLDSPS